MEKQDLYSQDQHYFVKLQQYFYMISIDLFFSR